MKVITLHDSRATCPECDGQAWEIVFDGFNFDFTRIKSFNCLYCDFKIELEIEKTLCFEKIKDK
jgi:hypothetical protein